MVFLGGKSCLQDRKIKKLKFVGVSQKILTKFNGENICFKRSDENYFNYLDSREKANDR